MKLEHIVYDVWLDDPEILKYVILLEQIITDAALAGGAHIIHSRWHQFEPWGVTGFLLLQESHISIHTWPEENFAAIDVFPCGSMNTQLILQTLKGSLNPSQEKVTYLTRGDEQYHSN